MIIRKNRQRSALKNVFNLELIFEIRKAAYKVFD